MDLLDVRGVVDAWTTSADVEATKPDPDLVRAALERDAGAVAVFESVAELHDRLDETSLLSIGRPRRRSRCMLAACIESGGSSCPTARRS